MNPTKKNKTRKKALLKGRRTKVRVRTMLKVGDMVQVVAGENRNATQERGSNRGRVLKIDRVKGLVTIAEVNRHTKHRRRDQDHPRGQRMQKELPVAISNVMLVAPDTNEPGRFRYEAARADSELKAQGAKTYKAKRKVRVSMKTGKSID